MKLIIMVFVALSLAHASGRNPIEDKIAHNLDLLFSDTVNEGDQNATVTQTKCRTQATSFQNIDRVNCQVSIELQMIYSGQAQTCHKTCDVSYQMKDKDIESLEVVEDSIIACFEGLTQGC